MTLRVGLLLSTLACTSPRGDAPRDHSSIEPAAAAVPAFSVELRRITKHPTCLGNERVKVDDQGAVVSATNQAECAAGTVWSTPYPAAPRYRLTAAERDQLGRLLQTSGVMDLPPLTTDPAKVTTDGAREELDILVGSRHAVVAVEGTEVAAFAKVRQALLDLSKR